MAESSETQQVKGTKRQWTTKEDAYLVEGLLHLVENGWRADAGTFKPGYTKELEKYLLKKNPNCTLKASPHIESRVKHMKKQYGAIKEMLGPHASGFGWDDTRKMIIVEKDIYRQWCKSHPAAIGLFGKPFPHFDSLEFAFGKDRATGVHAESPADAAYSMMKDFFQTMQEHESGVINLDGDAINVGSQMLESSFNHTTTTQESSPLDQSQNESAIDKGEKRKGKRVKYNDDVSVNLVTSMNKLSEFYAGTVEHIQQLTSCFLHEKEAAERKKQVTAKLETIEGLSEEDIVRASMLISDNDNLCGCFFTMHTMTRMKTFVDIVLNKNSVSRI